MQAQSTIYGAVWEREKMRSLRTLTTGLMASAMMIGPAFAHRSWFMLDYTDAQCHVSQQSPQAIYDMFDTPLGHMQGIRA